MVAGRFTVVLIILGGLLATARTSQEISVLGNRNSVVILSCNIPIGVYPNTVRWSQNGASITASEKYIITDYTRLEIRNVVPGDEGEYKCSYTTTYGSTAELVVREVYVLGAAQFVQNRTPEEISVYIGESPKFDTRLEYVGGGASGRIQRTKVLQLYFRQLGSTKYSRVYSCSDSQNQCLDSGRITVERTPNSHMFDFSLRLREATQSDVGSYIVRVENVEPLGGGVVYIRKEFNLNVREPPPSPELFLQAAGTPIDGGTFSLSCRADTNIEQYTNFELQWTNSKGDVISVGQQAQLDIMFEPLIKAQHEGQYTCSMVAGLNGSELLLTSNKTIAVLVEALDDQEDFQIIFGRVDLRQCTNWMLDTERGAKLEEAIQQNIIQAVSDLCDCDVTSESLQTNYLKCLETNQLGYRATFSGTHTLTASDFITHIESWLKSSNSVIQVGWFLLDLDAACPVVVPNDATSTSGWCMSTVPETPSSTLQPTVDSGSPVSLNYTQISQCVTTCLISESV